MAKNRWDANSGRRFYVYEKKLVFRCPYGRVFPYCGSAKSRNFRRRGYDYDDNTDTSTPAPKKLLSFAEEEEEDREQAVSRIPSKLKPSSSSSHKLTSSQDKPPPTTTHSTTASNVHPRAGVYIMEALLELQRITRTLVQSSSSSELKNT
ncbi:hypothetical protein OIU76_012810 [Salix suchowensis]|nr:hypothetical protein OIU76_012810 [Salix suchowensis]